MTTASVVAALERGGHAPSLTAGAYFFPGIFSQTFSCEPIAPKATDSYEALTVIFTFRPLNFRGILLSEPGARLTNRRPLLT